MSRLSLLPLALMCGLGLTTSHLSGQDPTKGELREVSYADLGRMVRGMTGKVVLVYFWSFG